MKKNAEAVSAFEPEFVAGLTKIFDEMIPFNRVLRLGSRVATARMEFLGADGTLLASGAAAYIVS